MNLLVVTSIIFTTTITIQPHIGNTAATCIWYGQCGDNQLNCVYNGAAKPLTDVDAASYLQQICPTMFPPGQTPLTCCNADQVNALQDNLPQLQSFFGRCPNCFSNIALLFCGMSCAPDQTRFIDQSQIVTTDDDPPAVSSVGQLNVSNVTAQAIWASCINVQSPEANMAVVEMFNLQSVADLFNLIGNPQAQPLVPFFIGYQVAANDSQALTFNATNCNELDVATGLTCSCADCPAACKANPTAPSGPASKCTVTASQIDCVLFGTFIAAGCIAVVILIAAIIYYHSTRQRKHQDEHYGNKPMQLVNNAACQLAIDQLRERYEIEMSKAFRHWGLICCRHPFVVGIIPVVIFVAFVFGWIVVPVTLNVDIFQLWASPDSTEYKHKAYFDQHFGPFYRTEMIILRPKNVSKTEWSDCNLFYDFNYTNLFSKAFLLNALKLVDDISSLQATYGGGNKTVQLSDICLKPLAPDNNGCTIFHPMQFFQGNATYLDEQICQPNDYIQHFMNCMESPISTIDDAAFFDVSCLAANGVPNFPWLVFGGYNASSTSKLSYFDSTAFIITIPVVNQVSDAANEAALAWEAEFLSHLANFTANRSSDLFVAYSAERSINDEIARIGMDQFKVVGISYAAMFVYVALALGQYRNRGGCLGILISAKITVGLIGVLLVLLSVFSSIGIFAFAGLPPQVIVLDVVPFLILAIGVDNIFLLIQRYQRLPAPFGSDVAVVADHVAAVVSEVGPSMLLASGAELSAFFVASMSSAPIVRDFAVYSGLAITFNFLLQISTFVVVMYADACRMAACRIDVLYCIKAKQPKVVENNGGFIYFIFERVYVPFLSFFWIRVILVATGIAVTCLSVAGIANLTVGLNQSLAVPDDSYVVDYFTAQQNYLAVGAPVYFVLKDGYNYSNVTAQNRLCSSSGCDDSSLVSQLTWLSNNYPNVTYLAQPPASWLDDYFSWLKPSSKRTDCCAYSPTNKSFCSFAERSTDQSCQVCSSGFVKGRPTPSDFDHFLPYFLKDNPGVKCPKGGHAAYGDAVELIEDGTTGKYETGATYFMAYHTVMPGNDYTEALRFSRQFCEDFTSTLNGTGEVFAYSYPYFADEQYLDIYRQLFYQLGICLIPIFGITFILLGLGYILSSLIILAIVIQIVITVMGVMYIWQIPLNAISLVNLVACLGIAVEFCSHTVRRFALSLEPTRLERMQDALLHVGASVFSGITLTKIIGVSFLAISNSQLFIVFYFRMFIAVVVAGACYGLIYLPCLLSFIGPPLRQRQRTIADAAGITNAVPLSPAVMTNEDDVASTTAVRSSAVSDDPTAIHSSNNNDEVTTNFMASSNEGYESVSANGQTA